ncbi:MAG: hypothetical protein ACPG7F_00070 [Aggregatilineales bacterium]
MRYARHPITEVSPDGVSSIVTAHILRFPRWRFEIAFQASRYRIHFYAQRY